MAKNFEASGDVIDVALAADVVSGAGVLTGVIFGVALNDGLSGAVVPVQVSGVWVLPKAAQAITQGQALYWSTGNSNLTTTASGNTLVGKAVAAQASGDATVRCRLDG